MEETGYEVSVREFLGSMSYVTDSKIKIVQFWHMQAVGKPVRHPTREVKSVRWLSLKKAIGTLTRTHEKVFLANVGPVALKAAKDAKEVRRDKITGTSRNRGRGSGRRAPLSVEQALATR
jgi:8-oxo-dGTP diphosphatase